MLVLGDQRAERQELASGGRREPPPHVGARHLRRGFERVEPRHDLPQLPLEDEQVVAPRLDLHEEHVERRDLHADGVEAALESLDERRAGACEGVEDPSAGPQVAREQRLHELGDELPEVGVEPVDVLRPLALGQLALRPRELEVDVAVERFLGRGHAPPVFYGATGTPRTASSTIGPPPSGASSATSSSGS